MTAPGRELSERIRGQVVELDGVVQRALSAWPEAQKASATQTVFIDSVALNLHGFYAGLERLFELIARHVDQILPASDTWHRDLLEQVADAVQPRATLVVGVNHVPGGPA